MKRFAFLLLLALIAGCGGGGGGATSTITGIVLQVETGGAPNPQANIQVGGTSVLSSATDGSFSIVVPAGTTTLTVDSRTTGGVYTFTIPAAPSGQVEDVGDLWVGPNRITLTGTILDSASNNPVAGANLNFGGQVATSSSDGTFSITNVPYPNSNFAAFTGIVGSVTATNYITNSFTSGSGTPVSNILAIPTILMTAQSSTTPPGTPYTVYGTLTPTSLGASATVTLSQGGTALRITHADLNGHYQIWIGPGTYTLTFVNGTHSAPSTTVTVKSSSDVEQVNAALN